MSNLQVFNSPVFGQVRMVAVDDKPYAVGNDVAKSLCYSKPLEAINAHCRDPITYGVIDALGRKQKTKLIPEGDIYRLIIKAADQSNNPEIKAKAEKFERWVFDEVLPAIRKTGEYSRMNHLEIKLYELESRLNTVQ